MIDSLGIKDGDDLDFLKYGESTFLVAKKMDIVKLLSKNTPDEAKPAGKAYVPRSTGRAAHLEPQELAVLKKLDTLKYNDRTSVKVAPMLNSSEKETLQALINRSIVVPFRKGSEKEVRYSIQKSVYDAFLYRKKQEQQPAASQQVQKARPQLSSRQPKAWEQKIGGDNDVYIETLESKGFVVLGNEAEAAIVSASLEDSIRQGLILGTRAFNKKFYIGLRGFINKNAPKILKLIEQRSVDIEEIAKSVGLEEDGVRTILYVLSESGDVTEVRKDVFRAA
ncbi:MAG: hypothetical protein KGI06_02650 [Candidatus Micrarchaeota archaeon]|nr:hypothetical protein [Candidatus Micrarchaeota archaeon]